MAQKIEKVKKLKLNQDCSQPEYSAGGSGKVFMNDKYDITKTGDYFLVENLAPYLTLKESFNVHVSSIDFFVLVPVPVTE